MVEKLENMEGIRALSSDEADCIISEACEKLGAEDANLLRAYVLGLRDSARTDILTGMKNRRSWNEDFVRVLSSFDRGNSPNGVHSLFSFDLDFFKEVNDTYGHKAGDDVLRMVGKSVLDNVRGSDSAYRIGGDEFLVLFRNTSLAYAATAALKLDKVLSGQNVFIGREDGVKTHYQAKISGGLIEIKADHSSPGLYKNRDDTSALDCALGKVDELLYYAKHNGRNNIACKFGKYGNFGKQGKGITLLK